jgi:hypothetical protein
MVVKFAVPARALKKIGCAMLISTSTFAIGTRAEAQALNPFGSVIERVPPGYRQPPLIVAGFEISPKISLDVEAIDNVFASDLLERDDVTISFRPSASVRDRRPDRELALDVGAALTNYLGNTVSDRVQVYGRGQGRFGIGTRTRPFFGFEFRQDDTQSGSFPDLSLIAQPVQLTSISSNAGLEQEFGSVTATAEARYLRTQYRGEVLASAAPFVRAFDNFEILTGRARVAYSVNPARRIYVEGQINNRSYAVNPGGVTFADRSSTGFSMAVGYAWEITEILRFDGNVGYLLQDFNSSAIDLVSSVSLKADLYYSPSLLTRFRLGAARSIDDTVSPFSNGLLRSDFAVGVEHELRRNVILSAEGRYSSIESNDAAADLLAADGYEVQLSGSVRYLISPAWSARLRGSHLEQNSISNGSQSRLLLNLGYSF